MKILVTIFAYFIITAYCITNRDDIAVLNDFRNGIENSYILNWPENSDPCGSWPHIYCSSDGRVTQIQLRSMGLKGKLPQNLNRLVKLQNLGLQNNTFYGRLPSFNGLSELEYAYLCFNRFDTIPSDFFTGLVSLRALALDYNPLNASKGWVLPDEIQESVQLSYFSCIECNLNGVLPNFVGKLPSLVHLLLSYNKFVGEIPTSFGESNLQTLWLNDQDGEGLSGSINVIGSMFGLVELWLHGNSFTGTIPDSIGGLTLLTQLKVNRNKLTGQIPASLANMKLRVLSLESNMFMGSIPKFKSAQVAFSDNLFCQLVQGQQCSSTVNVLLDFLKFLNYPSILVSRWTGDNPCKTPWFGITCNQKMQISVINFQRLNLNGTLSPSLASLGSLIEIHLGGNNISGQIPKSLTELKSLRMLDLHENPLQPPFPQFRVDVNVVVDLENYKKSNGNLETLTPKTPLVQSENSTPLKANSQSQPPSSSSTPAKDNVSKLAIIILTSVIVFVVSFYLCVRSFKSCRTTEKIPHPHSVHPRDLSSSDETTNETVKVVIMAHETTTVSQPLSMSHNTDVRRLELSLSDKDRIFSTKLLRQVTDNFAPENELGRGGFGVVYKGVLENGTEVAVKRMDESRISRKALGEFEAEIRTLSNVRHRHLVSLYGYSIEDGERLLVYEYIPRGDLSKHLFHWKRFNLQPLSWAKRLVIALDVARGMQYLHQLANQSFIHRDLKSSNILLGDDFHAKVSDFGLVKLADDMTAIVTSRVAGTFGYIAPEYGRMGKMTTKIDVYSFGVVLMEILTGLRAIDDHRPEDRINLATWFWEIKSDQDMLISIIDPALESTEEILESIFSIAELAGHCTTEDPLHRTNMGHVVNVLSQLVEKWEPFEEVKEDSREFDYDTSSYFRSSQVLIQSEMNDRI